METLANSIGLELDYQIIAILAATIVVLWFLKIIFRHQKLSYYRIPVFTAAEINFLRALDNAMPDGYRVFGKMRIADVILPKKGLDRKNWQKGFWQISSKHFDFVVCDSFTLEPVLVIELNDSSHYRKDRISRDRVVGAVCESASLPILWLPAKRSYRFSELHDMLYQNLTKSTEAGMS